MALPTPDYDSLVTANPHTMASLTTDGFTEVGMVTDDPKGVTFGDATTDGAHKVWAEGDSWWYVEAEVKVLPAIAAAATAIAGLHQASSASNLDISGLYRPVGNQRGWGKADAGTTKFSPNGTPAMVASAGDVLRLIIVAQLDAAPGVVDVYLVGSTYIFHVDDPGASGTTRARFFIGGGNTGLGGSANASPVTITRIRRWDNIPTTAELVDALGGEPLVFSPGSSVLITADPILGHDSHTTTSVTLDLTHPANSTGMMIHYHTNKPGSTKATSGEHGTGVAQVTISGLTANEVYEFVATSHNSTEGGKVSEESNTIRVQLNSTGALSF